MPLHVHTWQLAQTSSQYTQLFYKCLQGKWMNEQSNIKEIRLLTLECHL